MLRKYLLPLEKQQRIFLEFIQKNPIVNTLLERGFVENINNWYLVSGCLNQTVWNKLTNRNIDYGICDYDLIYYDPDISPEKEKYIPAYLRP